MADKDEFGNRMKLYERMEERRFMPLLPVVARLDGRCFSQLTRGMERPYDDGKFLANMDCADTEAVHKLRAAVVGRGHGGGDG